MERAKEKNGQTLTPDAANLIAERTEGNLLATSQEIQKLALLVNKPEIDVSDALTLFPTFPVLIRNRCFLRCLKATPDRYPKL